MAERDAEQGVICYCPDRGDDYHQPGSPGCRQAAEIARLEAEVAHWKAHAEEAGEGFTRVCRDYARVTARNVVLTDALIAAGVPIPPASTDDGSDR